MEAVLLIGLQASGKSSFFKERLFATHVRISLDLLRTRHRERRLLAVCLETKQRFAIDNTNPNRAARQPYIAAAKAAGFPVVGYYLPSRVEDCLRRNDARPPDARVPPAAILSTAGRLERPAWEEGFDRLHYVRLEDGRFFVEDWRDEV